MATADDAALAYRAPPPESSLAPAESPSLKGKAE
jgi:hypothetical protein